MNKVLVIGTMMAVLLIQGCTNDAGMVEEKNKIVDILGESSTFKPQVNQGTDVVGREKISTPSTNPNKDHEPNASSNNLESGLNKVTDGIHESTNEHDLDQEISYDKPAKPLEPRYQYTPQKSQENVVTPILESKPRSSKKTLQERIDEIIETKKIVDEAEKNGYTVEIDKDGRVQIENEAIVVADKEGNYYFKDPNEEFQETRSNAVKKSSGSIYGNFTDPIKWLGRSSKLCFQCSQSINSYFH